MEPTPEPSTTSPGQVSPIEPSHVVSVDAPGSELIPSRGRTAAIITCITCITGISNLLAGLLTNSGLELWPASALALSCGCTLLLCATIADLIGCRRVCLIGALLQAGSAVGSGLATTLTQLIALRVLAGVAASLCLPSAVGIASRAFSSTHKAVGFGLGLALGGVFSDAVSWRWGFHSTAVLNVLVLALAIWSLPASLNGEFSGRAILRGLSHDIDWVGALMISASLALLSYVLAIVANSGAKEIMRQPLNLTLLCLGSALLPVFVIWMHFQTVRQKPALIPNKLWTNVPFTSIYVSVFFIWGALNASEQIAALYLQDVRGISALTSSLYFLPAPICGLIMNVVVAFILPYLRPSLAVPPACFVSGIAPLLLAALCKVHGPSYWNGIFQAMAINPLGADLMYTIAMLVVTDAFPAKTQALAGGVFNMLAQLGKSVGIATTAIIAQQVSDPVKGLTSQEALLKDYEAGWWYNCGLSFLAVFISFGGLRSVGKLGIKRD